MTSLPWSSLYLAKMKPQAPLHQFHCYSVHLDTVTCFLDLETRYPVNSEQTGRTSSAETKSETEQTFSLPWRWRISSWSSISVIKIFSKLINISSEHACRQTTLRFWVRMPAFRSFENISWIVSEVTFFHDSCSSPPDGLKNRQGVHHIWLKRTHTHEHRSLPRRNEKEAFSSGS